MYEWQKEQIVIKFLMKQYYTGGTAVALDKPSAVMWLNASVDHIALDHICFLWVHGVSACLSQKREHDYFACVCHRWKIQIRAARPHSLRLLITTLCPGNQPPVPMQQTRQLKITEYGSCCVNYLRVRHCETQTPQQYVEPGVSTLGVVSNQKAWLSFSSFQWVCVSIC